MKQSVMNFKHWKNYWLFISKVLPCVDYCDGLNVTIYKILVAASIIRPGVAQSGMMKEYIFRHNHPDQFEYFHETFKEHLGETYSVSEDVIKIACTLQEYPPLMEIAPRDEW
jgi:hypothetical protein